jgi:5-methylcytosine-specific restriction endonuclease McrA
MPAKGPRGYSAYDKSRIELTDARVQARREAIKRWGEAAVKGMDVDHKVPLSEGGTNAISNLRLRDPNENRADKSNMRHGHARTQKYTHDAAGYGKGR